MSLFMPERLFDTFRDLTPSCLTEQGIRALILDVDNTLEPYENPLPGEDVQHWIADLRSAGISCMIVSNNGEGRIRPFAEAIGLPFICHAAKPFPFAVTRARKRLGAEKSETAAIGDQIFTDVLAAHCAGIRACLVPPIRDKRDLLTRAKRLLERPILRKYRKKTSL